MIQKFDEITASNIINAAILKIIKISQNLHGRITSRQIKLLSSYSVQRKRQKSFTPHFLKILTLFYQTWDISGSKRHSHLANATVGSSLWRINTTLIYLGFYLNVSLCSFNISFKNIFISLQSSNFILQVILTKKVADEMLR